MITYIEGDNRIWWIGNINKVQTKKDKEKKEGK
jgi:hypothetical protein